MSRQNHVPDVAASLLLFPLMVLHIPATGDDRPPPSPPVPVTTLPETRYLHLDVGNVGVFQSDIDEGRYGLEYRLIPRTRWRLSPAIGGILAENDATYYYLGLRRDFYLNANWLLRPGFDVGAFNEKPELDLGNTIEFRTGLTLEYQFPSRYRIGLSLYHLSNGGLSDRNPGTEAITMSVSIPIKGH